MLSTQAPALSVCSAPLADGPFLLDFLPESDAVAWVNEGEGLVGWGTAARVELTGVDRFAQAQQWWDRQRSAAAVSDEVGLPGTGLVAFGSFAFDGRNSTSVLVIPRVVVGHRDGTSWVTCVGGPVVTPQPTTAARSPATVRFNAGSKTDAAWQGLVAAALHRIDGTNLSKVVLARDIEALFDEPLDVRWPLQSLARDYARCWTFLVDGLLGATPEMLVRVRGDSVMSRVLAGTLRRSGDLNQDRRQGDAFPRSIKDVEEHGYGVASVAEAFARHCREVQVPARPFVLELPNVLHLASDIVGTLTTGTSSLALLSDLHPSAAVCGTPTAAALEVIRSTEGLDRGRYAGPVGWMDSAGNADWGIALRCGQVDRADPRRVRLYAGCGIVAGSVPQRELAESNAKLVPMRSALQPATP